MRPFRRKQTLRQWIMSIWHNAKTSSHISTDLHNPHKEINDFPIQPHNINCLSEFLKTYVSYVLMSNNIQKNQKCCIANNGLNTCGYRNFAIPLFCYTI